MKIIIASPYATDNCLFGYTNTVAKLSVLLSERGIAFDYYAVRSSDVVLNRNVIAHSFVERSDATHLLMLDTDMEIEMRVFEHYLESGHDFMGAVYARRKLDLEAFHAHAQAGKDVDTAKALASDYPVRLPEGQLRYGNAFAPVEGIGMGCVLIARRVFEEVARQGHAPEIHDTLATLFGIGDRYRNYFGLMRGDDGSYTSEDFSFCKRVVDTEGVDIMGYIGPGVHHLGQFRYSSPFQNVLANASK